MGDQKNRFDENYEKPSRHKQWQERSERPVAAQGMTKQQIEGHRRNLVKSYDCDDKDITYEFHKISDEDDEDRDDCLWIKYKMKCVRLGKPVNQEIFSIKLPIPEDLKKMAEQMKKQQVNRSGMQTKPPVQLITAPPAQLAAAVPTAPTVTTEPAVPRPKLRKPVRK